VTGLTGSAAIEIGAQRAIVGIFGWKALGATIHATASRRLRVPVQSRIRRTAVADHGPRGRSRRLGAPPGLRGSRRVGTHGYRSRREPESGSGPGSDCPAATRW